MLILAKKQGNEYLTDIDILSSVSSVQPHRQEADMNIRKDVVIEGTDGQLHFSAFHPHYGVPNASAHFWHSFTPSYPLICHWMGGKWTAMNWDKEWILHKKALTWLNEHFPNGPPPKERPPA